MKFSFRSCMVSALLQLAAAAVSAQTVAPNGAPANGPLVLLLPGGTRALGLGNSFTAGRGAEVLWYNPAQIGLSSSTTISLERFGSAATLGSLATTGRVGGVAFGAGAELLDYGASPDSLGETPGSLGVRGPIDASSVVATVEAATTWSGMRWGGGVKYVAEQVAAGRAGGAAFDLGVARDVGDITVAFAAQNLGSDLAVNGQPIALPTRLSLGATLFNQTIATYFDLGVSATVSRERGGKIAPAAGAELSYIPVSGWTFVARVGARRVDQSGPSPESPLAFGGSIGVDRLWLDYAFEPSTGPGGAMHRLGLRIVQ